ncbi:MAG: hypothetical protein M3Y51_04910 [Actinomycetota bacterium]|nr:hypothetical protein [Actinomycetota bacterium]
MAPDRAPAPTDALSLLLEVGGAAVAIVAIVGALSLSSSESDRMADAIALGVAGVALGLIMSGLGRCVRYLQRQVDVTKRNLRLLRELSNE